MYFSTFSITVSNRFQRLTPCQEKSESQFTVTSTSLLTEAWRRLQRVLKNVCTFHIVFDVFGLTANESYIEPHIYVCVSQRLRNLVVLYVSDLDVWVCGCVPFSQKRPEIKWDSSSIRRACDAYALAHFYLYHCIHPSSAHTYDANSGTAFLISEREIK